MTKEYVDIFTLNHDTIIEKMLSARNIDYECGFGDVCNGCRYAAPERFDADCKIRLFKLHGSVDWTLVADQTDKWPSSSVVKVEDGDTWRARNKRGAFMQAVEHELMLIGTLNKLYGYTAGIFIDLYHRFYQSSRKADRIIVIGYGFGDIGINLRLFDWLDASDEYQMIIIDPAFEKLKVASPKDMRMYLEDCISKRKVKVINKGIQDVELADYLGDREN